MLHNQDRNNKTTLPNGTIREKVQCRHTVIGGPSVKDKNVESLNEHIVRRWRLRSDLGMNVLQKVTKGRHPCMDDMVFNLTHITDIEKIQPCNWHSTVSTGDRDYLFMPDGVYFTWVKYTLGKKGCYTPIEDNKTNVDRTFVFPLGWNWHDMDPWLFPNEIRHYLGQTFNARSSGIVELRNHSIGGRSPKSIFTLWQLWINICIFFQKFFWLFEQCPVQPLWVLGMRCLHLPVRALSKVLLLPVWVWLVLSSTAYSKGMLPLDLWCQASLQGLPERQHLGKTVHHWGWSDRIVSWVLRPWRRRWEICTEWGLVAQWLKTDSCPVVTGHIDPQRSPCWLSTTVVSAWSGRRGGGTRQWPTGSMSSSVMSRDSNFTR